MRIDWERALDHFTFFKEGDGIPIVAMIQPAGRTLPARGHAAGKGILSDAAKAYARLSRPS
jgi:hypothetical protein